MNRMGLFRTTSQEKSKPLIAQPLEVQLLVIHGKSSSRMPWAQKYTTFTQQTVAKTTAVPLETGAIESVVRYHPKSFKEGSGHAIRGLLSGHACFSDVASWDFKRDTVKDAQRVKATNNSQA